MHLDARAAARRGRRRGAPGAGRTARAAARRARQRRGAPRRRRRRRALGRRARGRRCPPGSPGRSPRPGAPTAVAAIDRRAPVRRADRPDRPASRRRPRAGPQALGAELLPTGSLRLPRPAAGLGASGLRRRRLVGAGRRRGAAGPAPRRPRRPAGARPLRRAGRQDPAARRRRRRGHRPRRSPSRGCAGSATTSPAPGSPPRSWSPTRSPGRPAAPFDAILRRRALHRHRHHPPPPGPAAPAGRRASSRRSSRCRRRSSPAPGTGSRRAGASSIASARCCRPRARRSSPASAPPSPRRGWCAPDPAALGIDPAWVDAAGGLRLRPDYWPERGGMDGFYAACLAKPGIAA